MPLTAISLHHDKNAAHITRASNRSFSTSFAAASLGLPSNQLRLLGALRQIDPLDGSCGRRSNAQFGRGEPLHLFGLGLLDAHQRGVAQLVDAGLNGEQRRQRHLDMLKPAVFQLALHANAAVAFFHLHDDGRHAAALEFGQHHAGLPVTQVVGLQAGQHQDRAFRLPAALASSLATPSVSNAGRFSSSIWMARSAPLASASRMVCDARAGPAQSTTTSPPCFSFSCRPLPARRHRAR